MQDSIGTRLESGVSGNFGIVRAIACYTVVIVHAYGVVLAEVGRDQYVHLFGFTPDWLAVNVFFLLSGMLLSYSLDFKPAFLPFVAGRLIRWMPAVFIAVLLAVLVVGPLMTRLPLEVYANPAALGEFIVNIISFQNVDTPLPGVFADNATGPSLFVPLWTMKYEILFSILLAASVATPVWRMKWVIYTGIAVTLVAWAIVFHDAGPLRANRPFEHMLRFAGAFALGIAIYRLRFRLPHSLPILAGLFAVALAANNTPAGPILGLLALGYGVAFVGTMKLKVPAVLLLIGSASYGIYIYAFPIQQILYAISPEASPIANGLWTIAFTTPFAVISWLAVEKPLNEWRRSHLHMKKAAVAA